MTQKEMLSVTFPALVTRTLRVSLAALLLLSCTAASQGTFAQCNPEPRFKWYAPDAYYTGNLGCAVDVNGTTAIAGAASDDENGNYSGAAYLFNAATGDFIVKLMPDDAAPYHWFGQSVAVNDSVALVGSPGGGAGGTSSGAAYLFDADTGSQLAKLMPEDAAALDFFGNAVAVDGTAAVIGAVGADDFGHGSGAAYLFDIATGNQTAKLLPDDGAANDDFGYAVAISGNTVIVGAHQDDDNGETSGSAYLFDVTTGNQTAKLVPDDGAAYDNFGLSVAISGTTALIGAPGDDDTGLGSGSAYLFDVVSGSQLAKLQFGAGGEFENFGYAVALDGTTAIISALLYDDYGISGTACFIDTTTGIQFGSVLPIDGSEHDRFGETVALDGFTAIVGAPDEGTYYQTIGAVHLFDTCPTISADFTCIPSSGTVPFSTQMTVTLTNTYTEQSRRIAGRIDVTLANSASFSNWRAGFTNLAAGQSRVIPWSQNIPSLMWLIGPNLFELAAQDVTPAPYNLPPYPPTGDTDVVSCTVTATKP